MTFCISSPGWTPCMSKPVIFQEIKKTMYIYCICIYCKECLPVCVCLSVPHITLKPSIRLTSNSVGTNKCSAVVVWTKITKDIVKPPAGFVSCL